jgi:hypothetical protein
VATPAAAPAWLEECPNAQGGVDTVFHSLGWRTATLAGQSVRWCQLDGGDGADGKTRHYIIQAWSDKPPRSCKRRPSCPETDHPALLRQKSDFRTRQEAFCVFKSTICRRKTPIFSQKPSKTGGDLRFP